MLAPDAERCTEGGSKGGGSAFRDVRKHFHDYGMELFCANEPMDYGKFRTELGLLFKALPCRGDKEALIGLWEGGEYSRLDRATVEAMAVMTDSPELVDRLEECEKTVVHGA